MRKGASFGIFLILLLIGTSTLVFNNLSSVDANLKTAKIHEIEGPDSQIRVFEHKISSLELEELKQKFGTFEEGRNYNIKINGHGTGLRPPTKEEWMEIAETAYFVEKIVSPQLGTPPSYVDLSSGPWFPPIGNQDGEGSCTAWAVGYYTKTFQEAKDQGWDLTGASWVGGYTGHPTPAYQDRIISPDFVYHLVNGGVDEGSSFYDAITLVCTIGASSWEKMPYDPADHSSWPPEEAWREAPLYRGNSSGIEVMPLESDANITSLKTWLASERLAMIVLDANKYDDFPLGQDVWTLDNYVPPFSYNHANTIVGYDDAYAYTEAGESRTGAFKIANSWGLGGWEHVADGFYWISYEAMKARFGSAMFYRDRIGYDPKIVASLNVDHPKRSECDTLIGMGDHGNPTAAKSFSNLTYGGEFPFCSNDIVLDITEFEDAVQTAYNQSFFLQIYDQDVVIPHSGAQCWYSDGVGNSWFRLGQAFSIPGTGATLNFWTRYDIEEGYDWGYVEVHDLNTDEWYTLPGLMTVSTRPEIYDNPNCPTEFEPSMGYDRNRRWNALTGFSGDDYYQEEMDLTPFANHDIELYFTYYTDPFVLGFGWYIDDIEIPEIGFFDDVESGSDGWTVSNLPPSADGWHIPPPTPTGTILSFSIEYYGNYSSGAPIIECISDDPPVNTTNLDYVYADTELRITGDLDVDGDVDSIDLEIFVGAYGTSPPSDPRADLDDDGDVDPNDFAILAKDYGKSI